MPYITFARPTDETTQKEKKLRSAEKEKERIIHGPKTLDAYHLGATNDEETLDQNTQQVVFRHARKKISDYQERRKHGKRIEDSEIPILHVGQLWLWVIDEGMSESRIGCFGKDTC